MPSVGMRRTTRVFGARVLRSGRRLFHVQDEEMEGKQHMRRTPVAVAEAGEDWIELFDHGDDGWRNSMEESAIGSDDDQEHQHREIKLGKFKKLGLIDHDHNLDDSVIENKRWGEVYSRKRKRNLSVDSDLECSSLDKRYGRKFFRKKITARLGRSNCDSNSSFMVKDESCKGLITFLDPCDSYNNGFSDGISSRYDRFSGFLNLVLRYMRNAVVFSWRQLSSFVLSEPITSVYSSIGIRFLEASTCTTSSGFCKIYGSYLFVPIFTVDFRSIPSCFLYMHSSLFLKYAFLSYLLEIRSINMNLVDDDMTRDDFEDLPSIVTTKPSIEPLVYERAKSRINKNSRVKKNKSSGTNSTQRNCIVTRSTTLKTKNSPRSKKRRNPSSFSRNSDLLLKDGVPFFPIKSNPEISRSTRRANVKELKSNLVGLTQDIESATCNASLLVTESDICYRERGVVITMEMSEPERWFLVVKRNDSERIRVAARDVMRPCFCNRITRAIIWAGGDDSWKLEFPDRQNWSVFKEMYRECFDRSVRAPVASVIPVPRVSEVSGYEDEGYLPFRLPESYISSRGDEVSRALEKSVSIYDMDSEDDEWLKKFNDERFGDREPEKRVLEDGFEKIIDGFERGMFLSPDDYTNAISAIDRCQGMAPKEVLEEVYGYWMAKRKKKRSALVRLFQYYQPRRSEQLSFKDVLRRKRSFKRRRHANKTGRGKQLTFSKAHERNEAEEARIAAEEAQMAAMKVEETAAAARRSEETAIFRRQAAQRSMEIADLATYRATIALRIAEARAAAESSP